MLLAGFEDVRAPGRVRHGDWLGVLNGSGGYVQSGFVDGDGGERRESVQEQAIKNSKS